ncbi:cholinesterase-like isoform X2 [Ornithodoros turicata]
MTLWKTTTEPDDTTVVTPLGRIKGIIEHLDADLSAFAFLGVPYGRTTALHRRFRIPKAVGKWRTLLQANEKRPPCPQPPHYVTSTLLLHNAQVTEDCLHLNIWKPPKGSKMPVLFVIYGSDHVNGGNHAPFIDGRYVAAHGGVVVVVPSYRLNLFGFLSSEIVGIDSNAGLHDLLLALSWVRSNIKSFDGNPDNVIIHGLGSGAVLASNLYVSPMLKGAVRRFVLQGGSGYTLPQLRRKNDTEDFLEYARRLDCDDSDVDSALSCIREQKLEDLLLHYNPYDFTFFPRKDGTLLPFDVVDILERGKLPEAEFLVGNVMNEGATFHEYILLRLSGISADEDTMDRIIQRAFDYRLSRYYVPETETSAIQRKYELAKAKEHPGADVLEVLAEAMGDAMYVCPTCMFADKVAASGSKVYYYVYDYRPTFSAFDEEAGVGHLEDAYIMFGNAFAARNATKKEKELSLRMIRMLSSFAKTGLPWRQGSDKWLPFERHRRFYNVIKLLTSSIAQKFREDYCTEWKALLYR